MQASIFRIITMSTACLVRTGRAFKTASNRVFCRPSTSNHINNFSTGSSGINQDEKVDNRSTERDLYRFLRNKIQTTGPVSVAQYMRMCLTSPTSGYYSSDKSASLTSSEIIGSKGDFITTPEITQMLGELLGVWIFYEVSFMGHSGPVQLTELGPGTGALMSDILRTLASVGLKGDRLSVNLVEISESLRQKQRDALGNTFEDFKDGDVPRARGVGKFGHHIRWYSRLSEVPRGFAVTVAHEFLDALPVHQFRRDADGRWREVFVDYDADKQRLRFALAPQDSLHQKVWIPEFIKNDPAFYEYEACPSAVTLSHDLAERISEDGGAALIIDYGHSGDRKRHSLRAYSRHALVDPLERPGGVDLTCDVNFAAVKEALLDDNRCCVYGPITQRTFLTNMGVQLRYEKLLKSCQTDRQTDILKRAYEIMMSEKEMGERFKVLAAFPKTLQSVLTARKDAPAGFVDCRLVSP